MKVYEKKLLSINHQENAHKKYSEISSHTVRMAIIKNQMVASVG